MCGVVVNHHHIDSRGLVKSIQQAARRRATVQDGDAGDARISKRFEAAFVWTESLCVALWHRDGGLSAAWGTGESERFDQNRLGRSSVDIEVAQDSDAARAGGMKQSLGRLRCVVGLTHRGSAIS